MKEHEVLIEHISTELMIEDPITKALPPKQYRKHVDHIGLVNPFDIWLHFLLVDCLDNFYVILRDLSDVLCT